MKYAGTELFINEYFIIFWDISEHFDFLTGFCKKNKIFSNLPLFLQIAFVIFGYQTWDLEGGGVK